ncbi:hypothetical protein XELAEV_18040504mg, partial [Xenopus laevis]
MSCSASALIIFFLQSVVTAAQFSDPKLSVSPNPPKEGDEITFTCSMPNDFNTITSKKMYSFSKNGRVVQDFGSKHIYRISSASPNVSGYYTCTVQLSEAPNDTRRASTRIKVPELFSTPKIEVSPHSMSEGATNRLICSTDILNGSAPLQFVFLKNGLKVKEVISTEKYQIYEMQMNDSGDYTCEVRTRDDKVKKRSQTLRIAFGRDKDSEEETDTQFPGILLIIGVALLFKYRQKCSALCTDQRLPPPPPVPDRDPVTREDLCYARVDFIKVQK